MTPYPLVRARVGIGNGERQEVLGRLLGRMTRVGGKAIAGEVELVEDGFGRRVSLVPVDDLVFLNAEALAVAGDAGPTPRAAMLGPA